MYRFLVIILAFLIIVVTMSGCKKNTEQTEKTSLVVKETKPDSTIHTAATNEKRVLLPAAEITDYYTIPQQVEVPPAPKNALDSVGNRTVKSVIDSTIKEVIHQRFSNINNRLSQINPDNYKQFLDTLKTFVTDTSPCQDMVTAILEEKNNKKKHLNLRILLDNCKLDADTDLKILTVPTMRFDKNNVLVSGLIENTTGSKYTSLLAIKKTKGNALIITPQIITAWPGKEESAIAVIRPEDGPWEVVAFLNESVIPAMKYHLKQIKPPTNEQREIRYPKDVYKEQMLIYLKDKDIMGWIPKDSCAFFPDSAGGFLRDVAGFYKDKYAIIYHGWWQIPDFCGEHLEEGEDTVFSSVGDRFYYDFNNLVELYLQGNGFEARDIKPLIVQSNYAHHGWECIGSNNLKSTDKFYPNEFKSNYKFDFYYAITDSSILVNLEDISGFKHKYESVMENNKLVLVPGMFGIYRKINIIMDRW
jgi:hypothetical protein